VGRWEVVCPRCVRRAGTARPPEVCSGCDAVESTHGGRLRVAPDGALYCGRGGVCSDRLAHKPAYAWLARTWMLWERAVRLGVVAPEAGEEIRKVCAVEVARKAAAAYAGGFAGNAIRWRWWREVWATVTEEAPQATHCRGNTRKPLTKVGDEEEWETVWKAGREAETAQRTAAAAATEGCQATAGGFRRREEGDDGGGEGGGQDRKGQTADGRERVSGSQPTLEAFFRKAGGGQSQTQQGREGSGGTGRSRGKGTGTGKVGQHHGQHGSARDGGRRLDTGNGGLGDRAGGAITAHMYMSKYSRRAGKGGCGATKRTRHTLSLRKFCCKLPSERLVRKFKHAFTCISLTHNRHPHARRHTGARHVGTALPRCAAFASPKATGPRQARQPAAHEHSHLPSAGARSGRDAFSPAAEGRRGAFGLKSRETNARRGGRRRCRANGGRGSRAGRSKCRAVEVTRTAVLCCVIRADAAGTLGRGGTSDRWCRGARVLWGTHRERPPRPVR
jgi:hypothetical protein